MHLFLDDCRCTWRSKSSFAFREYAVAHRSVMSIMSAECCLPSTNANPPAHAAGNGVSDDSNTSGGGGSSSGSGGCIISGSSGSGGGGGGSSSRGEVDESGVVAINEDRCCRRTTIVGGRLLVTGSIKEREKAAATNLFIEFIFLFIYY